MASFFDKYINAVEKSETILYTGRVTAVRGMLIESFGPRSVIGEMCSIKFMREDKSVLAEVVGLNGAIVQLMVYDETKGIEIGCEVVASGNVLQVAVGPELLGRVIDATGKPYDDKPEIVTDTFYPALASPPNPMERRPPKERIVTGVRAIDSLLAVAKGQRLGIFAGSGVGKSTLLSMIARNTNADINVIALVGERGREVLDFIQRDLGEEGLKRSVVVVSTSDKSSIARLRAAYTATAVAEYFRDQGKDVMLMFDSVTRFAHAQREIGLAAGEAPAQRGYPPSVFDLLPKLLERSGTNKKGSITGFYTVLVDGDDMDEPITDKVRGTLDGHIVSGHVDGVGQVEVMEPKAESWHLVVRAPMKLSPYLAYKGSITVNGVSLTINEVEDTPVGTRVSINLISHTVEVTTLKRLKAQDWVNLEIDTIARYVERMMSLRDNDGLF